MILSLQCQNEHQGHQHYALGNTWDYWSVVGLHTQSSAGSGITMTQSHQRFCSDESCVIFLWCGAQYQRPCWCLRSDTHQQVGSFPLIKTAWLVFNSIDKLYLTWVVRSETMNVDYIFSYYIGDSLFRRRQCVPWICIVYMLRRQGDSWLVHACDVPANLMVLGQCYTIVRK